MLWVKAFHIIFMVTWFAGLFYLPRLYVYHASSDDDISNERFKVMERKLFIIMTIGAVATTIFGLWMLFDYAFSAYYMSFWLYLKLLLIAALYYYHYACYKILEDFRYDVNVRDHVYYRFFNEVPVLILFGIIIFVVVKPF
jgi:putative membrane protein